MTATELQASYLDWDPLMVRADEPGHGYDADEGGCYCGRPGCGTADDYRRDFPELAEEVKADEPSPEAARELAEAAKFEQWAREFTARAGREPRLRAEHTRCAKECRRKAHDCREQAAWLEGRRHRADGRWEWSR